MLRRAVALLVVLATLDVAGSASTASANQPATVQLRPCVGEHAECGYVTVPLDRADPGAGTIDLWFERYPRRDRSQPPLETIVAVEGGPGYATTHSRSWYLDLFGPLRGRHDLLFVDNRGTGRSGAIDCPRLQAYQGNYLAAVASCGRQLGDTANLYGTGNAADDLAAVLDALGLATVDLYGDSYGTYFGQTFAVRHGDRLRALVLDAAYPVEAPDPFYRDTSRAANDAFRATCAQNAACAALGGDVMARLAALLDRVRTGPPVEGVAYDADGVARAVVATPGALVDLVTGAATSPVVYRELDAAGRALLDDGDPAPLLRMVAEATYYGTAGAVRSYSEGLYVAVSCHDYTQAFEMTHSTGQRRDELTASLTDLLTNDPGGFAPFTVREWLTAPAAEFDSCTVWPTIDARNRDLPIPPGSAYPDVPVLVLAGGLDSLTSPEGARQVADKFPNSTFVEVANTTHVTALGDFGRCASTIVLRFFTTLDAGDTSCADRYAEVRMVDRFWRRASDAPPATPAPGDESTPADRRVVTAAAATVSDVMARWLSMIGSEGRGLRGGSFRTSRSNVVRFDLDDVAFTDDLTVSGRLTWDRATGPVTADVTLAGAATGALHLEWDDRQPVGLASASGTVDGDVVSATLPAP